MRHSQDKGTNGSKTEMDDHQSGVIPQPDENTKDADEDNAASQPSTPDISSDEENDSDASDYEHVAVKNCKRFITEQDQWEKNALNLAQHLRDRPLLPPHPQDANLSWENVDDGIQLPLWHCAFKGCPEVFESETDLADHLKKLHANTFKRYWGEIHRSSKFSEDRQKESRWYLDRYCYAIRTPERNGIPAHGLSIDRRCLNHVAEAMDDSKVCSLICCCCAQIYTSWQGYTCTAYSNKAIESDAINKHSLG